jgi:transposase-like protein
MKKVYEQSKSKSNGIYRGLKEKISIMSPGNPEAIFEAVMSLAEDLVESYETIKSHAAKAAITVMQALMELETEEIAGKRYMHNPEREANRWGSEEGHVIFGGRKMKVKRPRVRRSDGCEARLETYGKFREGSRIQGDVERRVVRRVSTRNYEGVIDDIQEGYGIKKSSVSRQWKAASAEKVREVMERPLGDLDLLAIMIDGIHFHEYLLVAAVGVDITGRKHVLGLWSGATENSAVCGGLLDSLFERGLNPEQKYLFVIDGSKALKKGIVERFGGRAIIQRCIVHKERNVLNHISKKYHAIVRLKLRAAWSMKSYDDAKDALGKVVSYLREINTSAAASLEEAFEETLTLHRLCLPDLLRKSLRSTNIIESCFSTTRDLCRNVKRWRNSDMALRWGGAMLLEAEKKFRRIRGCRSMAVLASVLGRGDVQGKIIDKGGAVA